MKKQENLALLIDIENVIVGVGQMGLPIDIGKVLSKLLEEFINLNIRIRRAYGDIYAALKQLERSVGEQNVKGMGMHGQIRRNLGENFVQIEDTPYLGRKNSADISLTVDALSIAYTSPEINYFAILSSDRDYIPLILKLREIGKTVIGFGIQPGGVNILYVKACDTFYYYSTLFPGQEPREEKADDHVRQDTGSTIDEYFQLLIQAMKTLNQQGKQAQGAQLVPLMRQLRPDYDPKLLGLYSSKDLADKASKLGLVNFKATGGDFIVEPAERATSEPLQRHLSLDPSELSINPNDLDSCVTAYREFFQKKLKIKEIPDADTRDAIYNCLAEVLGEGGPIYLDDLSHRIAAMVDRPELAPQPSIFKILYGLYRRDVFSHDPSVVDPNTFNKYITGIIIEKSECDYYFINNCIRVMSNEKRDWPIVENALAEIFGVTAAKIRDLLEKLWE